jgi:hypothetical protein
MLAGTETAHALAYRIVYPQAQVRWRVLAATGHGYLGWAPLLLGLCFGIAGIGLLSVLVDAMRRRATTAVAPWAFALLPLIGFTVQEFLERWLTAGRVPWWMFEQPTFRVGLALQLPFGLLAYLAARLLLRAARSIGAVLRSWLSRPAFVFALPSLLQPKQSGAARLRTSALGWGVRGPPRLV